ncbi:MAG: tetratricopeptide repeat protein [Alphaproteobacteria bacterium]
MNRKQRRAASAGKQGRETPAAPAPTAPASAGAPLTMATPGFAVALQAHRLTTEGRLAEAEAMFRESLRINPRLWPALHALGVLVYQAGRPVEAEALLRRAVTENPTDGRSWANLGGVLNDLDREKEAIAALAEAMRLLPEDALALNSLGLVHMSAKRFDDAIRCFERAVASNPTLAVAYGNLGHALWRRSDLARAIEACRRSLAIDPTLVSGHINLAIALSHAGDRDGALEHARRAIALVPDSFEAHNAEGLILFDMKRMREAVESLSRAVALNPSHFAGHLNRASALSRLGRTREALDGFRRSMAIDPTSHAAHSNLIFCLVYDADSTGPDILAECRRWNDRHAAGVPPMPHANTRDPDRRLKVGYMSPDFRSHAMAFFLEPWFAHHDRAQVEVYAYAELAAPDGVTPRIQKQVDHWRVTAGRSDEDVARMIQADGIDILVDCAGHSQGSRLRVLAHRPAPVQVSTILGNASSTGLAAIDCIFGDHHSTPEGYEAHFSEKLVRLPHFLAPFLPGDTWPEVAPPLPEDQPILFANVSDPSRIGPDMVAAWLRILDRLPNSRVVLKNGLFDDPTGHDHWREVFAPLGSRLDLEGVPGGWSENMDFYGRVSVILDAFPVVGVTTTLIPLWMGVPVVGLVGHHAAQRWANAPALTLLGLGDLAVDSYDDYVEAAVRLAEDRPRLAALRQTLRPTMAGSPICDARLVVADIEAAYREMWRRWCIR